MLQALGSAATEVRNRLGESLASLERFAAPIDQATTPSLEALKAYSLGNQRRGQAREDEALAFYERATQLDPNFAMAWARLSVIHYNFLDFTKSLVAAERAYALRDRVSELERFYIIGRYQAVTGDTAGLRRTYQLWKETYPRDTAPRNNLALLLAQRGDHEAAVVEALEANRIDPTSPFPYANLCTSYIALNKLAEGRAIALKGVEVRPRYGAVQACLYTIAYLEKNAEEMQRIEQATATTPAGLEIGEIGLRATLAAGKVREMMTALRQAEPAIVKAGRQPALSEAIAVFAMNATLLGDHVTAGRLADQALKLSTPEDVAWSVPLVYNMIGRPQAAAPIATVQEKRFAADADFVEFFLPTNEAMAAMARGDHAAAAERLKPIEYIERSRPMLPTRADARCLPRASTRKPRSHFSAPSIIAFPSSRVRSAPCARSGWHGSA